MRNKKLKMKLNLKKETVSKLDAKGLNVVKGGYLSFWPLPQPIESVHECHA